jgi:outer membrane receptor protein involved in Fe transport
MNKKFALSLVAIVFLFSITHVYAQVGAAGTGSVSGRLLDDATTQPLGFATVALVKRADNSPVKSIQTDLNGNFKLANIPDGFYKLIATYVGYAPFTRDSILIGPKKRAFVFNAIKLKLAKGLLKEVAVKAQRNTIQLGIDKKTFSVDQSLVSQGGSATDLLSNVPSVQVDVDGNLNLRGSSSVRVLINGKPSALTGSSMADVLQSIPASSIESIEVITNPSAKYDAEGQSGIINIILKKNARLGFNGSAAASVGTQDTYTGNINLAYQDKAINIYANYGYRKANRVGNGYTDKITYDPVNGPIYQNQIADQNTLFIANNIRAGIDINLDPKTTLSFSANGNLRDRDRYQFGNTTITNSKGILTQSTDQNTASHSKGASNYDFNADYDHKYKKAGEELTANIGYSTSNQTNNDLETILYNYYTPASARQYNQSTAGSSDGYNVNLQADFTTPLKNNSKLDAGYRSTFSQSNSNNDVDTLNTLNNYVPNYILTNHFLYQEQIHAIYGNYQRQFGKFGIQVGARLEEARIRTLLRDSSIYNGQNYFRIYPSVFLSEKLSENQTLQISYTRRVNRPRDRQISPFLDKSDPYNYQQGNPNLKPEDTHSFELSYINYWKILTLTSSLYYRLTNDDIQQIRTPLNSSVTLLRFQNITNAQNGGFELIAKVSATQSIDITANVNAYYRYLQGIPALNLPTSSGYAWNANLTANLKPLKKLGVQLRGDYQAPQVITQGRQRAMYGLDGGLKYDVTKALNVSANVRDAFDTRKFGSIIDNTLGAYPYHSESVRRFQSRVILFTVAYRFGSSPDDVKKKKKDKTKEPNPDDPSANPDDPTTGGGMGGGTTPPPLGNGNKLR